MNGLALFPGHYGKDSGAVDGINTAAGDIYHTLEATITSGIVSKVALFLSLLHLDHKIGIGSFATRISATKDCRAGISIHADSITNPSVHGFHICYYPQSAEGKRLAESVDAEMQVYTVRARKIHARSDLAILKRTSFPCILVEVGFLSNVIEESALLIEGTQYAIAWGIVSGYRKWFYR